MKRSYITHSEYIAHSRCAFVRALIDRGAGERCGELLKSDGVGFSRITVEKTINLAVGLSEAHRIFERSNNRQPRIKVVALEEHLEFARLLIRLFQALDYEVLDDQASLSFIFRAKNRHDKLKVRYKDAEEYTYFHSTLTHSLILTIPFEWDPFPSKSDADFVQIELGGEP